MLRRLRQASDAHVRFTFVTGSGYPNREVRQHLNRSLWRCLVQDEAQPTKNPMRLSRLLATRDLAAMNELPERYAARRCRRTNNHIAHCEGLAQLRQRRYAGKYRARVEPSHRIGVEFSRDTRNLTAFEGADG